MKRLIYTVSVAIIAMIMPLSLFAVTQKEMDQARALAAKAYLRYANDGSGYLDAIHPKSMADLEKSLKTKEKENIKAFKAIPVPDGYASWDKQKLVDYWGIQAFTSKGLLEKGRIGRIQAKKNINAMTVTPPSKEQPAPQKTTEKDTDPKKQDTKSSAAPTDATSASPAANTIPANAADSTAAAAIAQAEAAADALSGLDEEPQLKKADSHTWIYILILCILVAVVVGLVVFASNIMKKNELAAGESDSRKNPAPQDSVPSGADANAMREKFAATLNAKNEEIRSLSKKIEALNSQNTTLKNNLESLTAESAALRSRLAEAGRKITEMQNAAAAAAANLSASAQSPTSPDIQTETRQQKQPPVQIATSKPAPQKQQAPASQLRTIYLGRANAKGIFVRADRTLNLGNSIFRLDTNDGYAGSFRVANDPTVSEMALLTPRESLSGACVVTDIDNTAGMTKIVNDSAGTAVFEGGCWRVIRKAKVHYE